MLCNFSELENSLPLISLSIHLQSVVYSHLSVVCSLKSFICSLKSFILLLAIHEKIHGHSWSFKFIHVSANHRFLFLSQYFWNIHLKRLTLQQKAIQSKMTLTDNHSEKLRILLFIFSPLKAS